MTTPKNDALATINEPLPNLDAPLATLDGRKMPQRATADKTTLGIIPESVDEAITVAKAFAASGMFPDAKTAGAALAKIMAGAEFGFPPAASMNAIHYVQGKLQMSGVAIGALIKRNRRYNYRIIAHDQTTCEIAFFEDGEHVGTEAFTLEDAKRQGTQNMTKFPKNMLFNRAMSNGAKFHCPDIFGGQPVYVEGEIIETTGEDMPQGTDRAASIKSVLTARANPEVAVEEPVDALFDGGDE